MWIVNQYNCINMQLWNVDGTTPVCVVYHCITAAGSKAKSMPCGHLFHDDCLISWVGKPKQKKRHVMT